MKLRATLDFLLNDWLHTTELTQRPRFTDHSRETFDAVLDTCERIASSLWLRFLCSLMLHSSQSVHSSVHKWSQEDVSRHHLGQSRIRLFAEH